MGNETEVLGLAQPEVEGYLAYGGDVYGNESHSPTVAHFFDNWIDTQNTMNISGATNSSSPVPFLGGAENARSVNTHLAAVIAFAMFLCL